MEEVTFTPLKRIHTKKGDVLRGLKKSESSFSEFGEAYFSFVNSRAIKGWKKHTQMTLNLIVPVGAIKFVTFDTRADSDHYNQIQTYILGEDNYGRLTVPPGVWMAFQGVSQDKNMLLNLASMEHDPEEALTAPLEQIEYNWEA